MEQIYETRKLAGKAIREMLDSVDPLVTFEVFTGNPGYSGEDQVEGQLVRFVNGRATLEGLPKGTDPDELEARANLLRWFANSEPKEVTMRIVEDLMAGTRTPVYGWRLVYRLEPAGKAAKAEKVPAGAA